MTGRTVAMWTRVYADGYDLSGYARTIGPLEIEYDIADMTVMEDTFKESLPNHPTIRAGTLNTVLDSTALVGGHTVLKTMTDRQIMVPVGISAAPALGDPVFCGKFRQNSYSGAEAGGAVMANAKLGGWIDTYSKSYDIPWGWMLLPYTDTGVNAANGIQKGGCTGGWFAYQLFDFTGAGTVTVSLQDSAAEGGVYANVVGGVTGAIDTGDIPVAGAVALARTQAVQDWVRFQVAFGGATTAVVMAFAWMPNIRSF
jgi:hypothetical protein